MIIGFDASRISVEKKTGVENYSEKLLHWFKKIDCSIYQDGGGYHNRYILYTPKLCGIELLDLPKNFMIRLIPFPRLWTQLRLPLVLKKDRPDLFFIPSHVMPFINYGVDTIVTIHDVAFRYFPESYTPFMRAYLDLTIRFMIKKAVKIITISNTTKDDLIRLYGADPGKIKVIYLGFDSPKKDTLHMAEGKWDGIKERYGIIRKYLLYVGRIETKKNLTNMIRAFYDVISSGQELQLILAGGSGNGYEKVLAVIEKYNLKDRVILTGYVSEEEKHYLLRNAEAFVFLSRYEGFGLPVLEAFYYELPVIASRIPVFEELYDGAVVFANHRDPKDIAEKIIDTLNNYRKRDDLAQKGKKLLEEFSWEKCAKETLVVLNEFGGKKE